MEFRRSAPASALFHLSEQLICRPPPWPDARPIHNRAPPEFAWLPPKEAIAAPQVCYRHCYASLTFPGVTKGDTFTDGSVSCAGSMSSQREDDLQAIANHECLYHKTDPSKPRPRLLQQNEFSDMLYGITLGGSQKARTFDLSLSPPIILKNRKMYLNRHDS